MGLDEGWVGVDDVATQFSTGKHPIDRLVGSRDPPARKVGRLLRFKLSQTDGWIAALGGEDKGANRGPSG